MLVDFTSGESLTTLSLVLILSFFLAYSIDTIMEHHGFGIWGNMLIINIQFQLGLWLSKSHVAPHFTNIEHMIAAIGFAFASLAIGSYIRAKIFKY